MADRPRPLYVNTQLLRARRFKYDEVRELIEMTRDEVMNAYHRQGVDSTHDPRYIDKAWTHSVLAAYHASHPPG